jgi:SOS-response transcriptional repressor LexA
MAKLRRMTTLSDRLELAKRHAGFKSQTALAVAAGLPQATVNRLLKRVGPQGPETATVKKLADACGVRFEWLMDGSGPMLVTHIANLANHIQPIARQRTPDLYPLYTLEGLARVPRESIGYTACSLKLGTTGFAIRIGEADIGSISGDPNLLKMAQFTMFAKREEPVAPGKILVVVRKDSPTALIRRLTIIEGQEFWESLNPLYPLRFKQREKDDKVLGVVLKADIVMNYAK